MYSRKQILLSKSEMKVGGIKTYLYIVSGNEKTGGVRFEFSYKLGAILLDGNEPKSNSPHFGVNPSSHYKI
jgi:hypothetical protein